VRTLKFAIVLLSSISAIVTFPGTMSAGSLIASCAEMSLSLNLDREICDGQVSANQAKIESLSKEKTQRSKLNDLAVVLRRIGHLDAARVVITQILKQEPANRVALLSAANITQAEYNYTVADVGEVFSAEARYLASTKGIALARQTFEQYELLIGNIQETKDETQIKSALNWIRFWAQLSTEIPNLKQLKQSKANKFNALVLGIGDRLQTLNSAEANEFKLSFTETLVQIPEFRSTTEQYAIQLLSLINPNTQPRSLSRALGIYGLLLSKTDAIKAIESFAKARSIALSVDAKDLAFQWEVESGRLSVQQGDHPAAKKLFRAANGHINELRSMRLGLTPETQYQLGEKTTAFFREYQSLLFSEERPDYREIISIYEQQKISEIENYLQCEKIDAVSLLEVPEGQRPDATLYLIRSIEQYELVIRLKNGQFYHEPINAFALNEVLNDARKFLNYNSLITMPINEIQRIFRQVYELTVGPVAEILPKSGTLVWVVDNRLQNIPWELLYSQNGKYLIEQYSIGYSLGSNLNIPMTRSKHPSILAAGISQPRENFKSLPGVETELEGIKNLYPEAKTLLNQSFTSDQISENADRTFIHIASHGQFSRDPRKTYILGWDEKLSLNRIGKLFEQRLKKPIELLYLSACETAAGDARATLGISGTAVKVSARSTIATLWAMDDESMSHFSLNFYRALQKGKTKAEALREAKLIAMRSTDAKFAKVANWASPVLIGLWQ
jgi:CHAT domain-containing protein